MAPGYSLIVCFVIDCLRYDDAEGVQGGRLSTGCVTNIRLLAELCGLALIFLSHIPEFDRDWRDRSYPSVTDGEFELIPANDDD